MQRLIWLGEVPFDGPPHRQPELARRLTSRFDVLFVEPPPPGRLPRLTTVMRANVRVAQAAPLLNARPALLRSALRAGSVRQVAKRLAQVQLGRLMRDADSPPIVVCSNVYLGAAGSVLRARLKVVDMCDDPRHYPGEPPWTHDLLVNSIRGAALVTTSSRALETEFQALGARRVEYLPNGVSDEQLVPVPTSMSRGSATPVIGFVGFIGAWVDLPLMERLAEATPFATIAIAGGVDASVKPAFDRLIRRANVQYLGEIPHAAVPELMAGFNVGLIPFHCTRYTQAVNPIKLYEYSAQNVPVVATAFSIDLEQFDGWIDVCQTELTFINAVVRRARYGNPRSTRWIAESHTWRATADRLAALIMQQVES